MNPEFRRQLWIGISGERLVALPVVLALGLALVGVGNHWNRTSLAIGALALGAAMSGFLGAAAAVESMLAEVRQRTWDWQRLSALGPFEMCVGKLFGSTLFSWYGSGLCYLVFVLLGGVQDAKEDPGFVVLLAVVLGLLVQAGGLLAAVAGLQRQSPRHVPTAGYALGVVGAVITLVVTLAVARMMPWEREWTIDWYDVNAPGVAVTFVSAGTFLVWAHLGLYRVMRAELQTRNAPWVWMCFVAFLAAYVAGFVPAIGGEPWMARNVGRAMIAHLVIIGLAYGTMISMNLHPPQVARLVASARTGDWRNFILDIPLWPMTLLLATASAGVAIALAEADPIDGEFAVSATSVALVLIVARDALLMFVLRVRGGIIGSDAWIAVTLGCAHVLIPMILEGLDLGMLRIVWSVRPSSGWFGVLALCAELVLLAVLAGATWSRYTARLTE